MSDQYAFLAAVSEATAALPLRRYCEEATFLAALGPIDGRTVLDVACGTGLYTRRFRQLGATRVVGLDASEPMVEYARYLEAKQPLGLEYVAADAAQAYTLGAFDTVAATYLLHYAPSRETLLAMCRSLRQALRPGGTLVSMVLNPDVELTNQGYYAPYGFTLAGPGEDGHEVTLTSILEHLPGKFTAYHWGRDTYEWALREAGFGPVRWHEPQVSAEGLAALGADFWRAYLHRPHAVVLSCS
jgi:toxoflavin synthase